MRAIEAEVQEIIRGDEAVDTDGTTTIVPSDPEGDPLVGGSVKRKPGRPATRRSSQVMAVETQLRRALGVKVVVHANGKGAGRIVIPFGDHEEFQRLLDHMAR